MSLFNLQTMYGIKSPFFLSSGGEGPDLLVCQPLAEKKVPHGFSLRWRRLNENETRTPFGLPNGYDADRKELARRLGLTDVVHMRQVHGKGMEVVSAPPTDTPTCDGLLTGRAGLGLVVTTADCVPMVIWDSEQDVVAAVHAGWRGTLVRIAGRAVELFKSRFSSIPESLHVAMGPAIGRCCYEVGDEVVQVFHRQFPAAGTLFSPGPRGKKHLDLLEANRRLFVDSGVPASQVYAADLCTSCQSDTLYSYRKEGKTVGRLFGVIGVAT